jgi:2-keto-3-deoxy-L-rhamnonate aldolase RhmA
MTEHVRRQDTAVTVIVMIEEEAAVAEADAILAVEGVDAVMIGCADLAVSLGEASVDSSNVCQAVQRVSRAAIATGRRVLAPASSVGAAKWLLDLGIDALVVSTDQGLLRAGATEVCRDFSVRRTEIAGKAV